MATTSFFFFLVLVLYTPQHSCAPFIPSCTELYPITPFPSCSHHRIRWTMGYISSGNFSVCSRFSMMRFAVEFIANYTNLLPNVTFDFLAADVQGLRTNALLAAVTQIRIFNVRSVLGSNSDTEADATAFLANEFAIPQLSATVQIPSYSDLRQYPYFMRLIPSYSEQKLVLIALMNHFQWTHAILITTLDAYGTTAAGYLLSSPYSLTSLSISVDGSDYADKIELLSKYMMHIRVVFMFTSTQPGTVFLQMIGEAGLIGKNYTYIMSQPMAQPFVENRTLHAQFEDLLEGAIGILPYGGEGAMFQNVATLWHDTGDRFPGPRPPPENLWYNFEAVYCQAVLLSNLIRQGYNINDLSGPDYFNALLNISYTGVTGYVKMLPDGDRLGNWRVVNFVFSKYVTVGKFFVGNSSLVLYRDFIFPGDSVVVPIDYIPFEAVVGEHKLRSYSAGFGVTIGVGTLFALTSLLILVYKWDSFRQRGPMYCLIIHIGVFFNFAAAATLTQKYTPELCMLFPWLVGIGFDLVYGCLFIKTMFLYHVFRQAAKFSHASTSPFCVLKFLSIFVTADMIVLLVWTFTFPFSVVEIRLIDSTYERRCQSSLVMWLIFLVPKGAWLIFGVVLSFLTRGLAKEYNESRSIGIVIYHDLCLITIAFPLGYAVQDIPGGILIILVGGIAECFSFTIFILFSPVWYDIFVDKHNANFKISQVTVRSRTQLTPSSPHLIIPSPVLTFPEAEA